MPGAKLKRKSVFGLFSRSKKAKPIADASDDEAGPSRPRGLNLRGRSHPQFNMSTMGVPPAILQGRTYNRALGTFAPAEPAAEPAAAPAAPAAAASTDSTAGLSFDARQNLTLWAIAAFVLYLAFPTIVEMAKQGVIVILVGFGFFYIFTSCQPLTNAMTLVKSKGMELVQPPGGDDSAEPAYQQDQDYGQYPGYD